MENMDQNESVSTSRKRQMTGTVVSDKMDKTIVVLVERRLLHPKYKKFVRKSAKYHFTRYCAKPFLSSTNLINITY